MKDSDACVNKEAIHKTIEPKDKNMVICTWILQVILIILIALGGIFYDCLFIHYNIALLINWCIFTGLTYILYFIGNGIFSPEWSYLWHKQQANSIHDYLSYLVSMPPIVTFHARCYHIETYYQKGKRKTTEVTTHRETSEFQFHSWRDISGLFVLQTDEANLRHKAYAKLNMGIDVIFDDNITSLDYNNHKNDFIAKNSGRDSKFSLTENITISKFHEKNLVRISSSGSCCVNFGLFIFFTFFIPLVEFYKLYVNYLCIEQEFIIKKTISSRYDLSLPQIDPCNTPGVVLNKNTTLFCRIGSKLTDNPPLPTQEELNESTSRPFARGVSKEEMLIEH